MKRVSVRAKDNRLAVVPRARESKSLSIAKRPGRPVVQNLDSVLYKELVKGESMFSGKLVNSVAPPEVSD